MFAKLAKSGNCSLNHLSMPPSNSREDWIIRHARELPPGRRADFLDGACTGDAALRQRVEALLGFEERLRANARAEEVLDTTLPDVGLLQERTEAQMQPSPIETREEAG